ncbi:MAG: peptidyl-prolyl cis-trans isomerase [Candidatus Eisenbacteria bacterium]|nr:peptidyl-prolyl cis-trans isomerase [Candidatus Eisenbacteria bacterium]
MDAWTKRMKVVADSLLAEVAKGAEFSSVVGWLSPRQGVIVTSDNFPGYWRGTAAQQKRLFDPRMTGVVFPEPIAGEEGWMIVRVEEVQPAHVAPLRDVAREVRNAAPRSQAARGGIRPARPLRDAARFARRAGMRVRWAVFDTAAMKVAEPTAADLDRYYRGHLADYSSFDASSGGVVAKPLADVRDDVRLRYLRDARVREARAAADRVTRAWAAGKRDPASEALSVVRGGRRSRGRGPRFDRRRTHWSPTRSGRTPCRARASSDARQLGRLAGDRTRPRECPDLRPGAAAARRGRQRRRAAEEEPKAAVRCSRRTRASSAAATCSRTRSVVVTPPAMLRCR